MPKRRKPPELTFQDHVAKCLADAHHYGVLEQSDITGSYNDAPHLCLAASDELQPIGPEALTEEHDRYWDIPLNESLPQPVIDFPIPATAVKEDATPYRTGDLLDFQTTPAPTASGMLFTEQPLPRRARKRRNRE